MGDFNYVTICRLCGKECYIEADHSAPDTTVSISKTPCDDPHYADKIWCTTCVDK